VVWDAVHLVVGASVAIKVLATDRGNPAARRMFASEVRSLARLDHPAVVRIFDHGVVPADLAARSDGQLRRGAPWLAMERVSGGTLAQAQHRPQSEAQLLRLLRSLARGLAHAHARGGAAPRPQARQRARGRAPRRPARPADHRLRHLAAGRPGARGGRHPQLGRPRAAGGPARPLRSVDRSVRPGPHGGAPGAGRAVAGARRVDRAGPPRPSPPIASGPRPRPGAPSRPATSRHPKAAACCPRWGCRCSRCAGRRWSAATPTSPGCVTSATWCGRRASRPWCSSAASRGADAPRSPTRSSSRSSKTASTPRTSGCGTTCTPTRPRRPSCGRPGRGWTWPSSTVPSRCGGPPPGGR
jgi:hypothetical protein